MAKVTILAACISSTLPKKDGQGTYTKHVQEAMIETRSCRVTIGLDVEDPSKQYALGDYTCDMEAQLKPGRFGLELPRYLKLVPAIAEAKQARTG